MTGHGFGQICGSVAVGSAVALQDRMPWAALCGLVATAMPFTHEETKKNTCPFTVGVAALACAYLFYDKHLA